MNGSLELLARPHDVAGAKNLYALPEVREAKRSGCYVIRRSRLLVRIPKVVSGAEQLVVVRLSVLVVLAAVSVTLKPDASEEADEGAGDDRQDFQGKLIFPPRSDLHTRG